MNVRPKKHLGQHFLTDQSIARRIAGSLTADRCSTVLEVGCGTGVLTRFLLEREDITLYGAEVDTESIVYLHEYFPGFAPRLMEGDFLRMNLAEQFPQGVNIIGNFPYNISSQIFFQVLEYRDLIPEVVGMVQREGVAGIERVRYPECLFAGFLRYRIPVYRQRGRFQSAAEGQERRHPPAPQRRAASRLR